MDGLCRDHVEHVNVFMTAVLAMLRVTDPTTCTARFESTNVGEKSVGMVQGVIIVNYPQKSARVNVFHPKQLRITRAWGALGHRRTQPVFYTVRCPSLPGGPA